MSLRRLLPYFLVLAAACLPILGSSQARPTAVWYEGARLIIGDKSPAIESSAFLVEGDSFTWVGRKGERQPPANATRVDLTGKTVMPALIDGHNHIGLVNEKDGSNTKANYTRENLVDQLERYAYYGTAATMSMGLEADQELAYKLRDEVIQCREVSNSWKRHRSNLDGRSAGRSAPRHSLRRGDTGRR